MSKFFTIMHDDGDVLVNKEKICFVEIRTSTIKIICSGDLDLTFKNTKENLSILNKILEVNNEQ